MYERERMPRQGDGHLITLQHPSIHWQPGSRQVADNCDTDAVVQLADDVLAPAPFSQKIYTSRCVRSVPLDVHF